jgi:hypothetical protein
MSWSFSSLMAQAKTKSKARDWEENDAKTDLMKRRRRSAKGNAQG